MHRYEGPLNKTSNTVVLLSYSDLSLDDRTILECYLHCWKIEVMFRSQKRYMGFKGFVIRAAKAFDRLLIILCFAHFFFTCGLGSGCLLRPLFALAEHFCDLFEFAHL